VATGAALNMCYGSSLGRSEVALHTPCRFRVEGHRVDQEAIVTDNFGDHDNRGKEPSARKGGTWATVPTATGEVVEGHHAAKVTEVIGVISISAVWTTLS
jgi:hypothetical protein